AIRLLIAMSSIHSLIIHHMDVKIEFLNAELDDEVYMNQPQGFIMPGNENKVCKLINSLYGLKKFDESSKRVIFCLYVDDMLIFSTDQVHIYLKKEFSSSRFSMKDMKEADVVMGIRSKHKMGKLSRYTSNPDAQHWQAIQRDTLMQAGSATLKTIHLPVARYSCLAVAQFLRLLAAAGKEAEWLKNLILEILLWVKPIAPIFIRCDSVDTLAKAYSQMYNGNSKHLGVRHNMICELIMNGVVSIEFVRSQKNLDDHLVKGLARDLVIKSAE
nr:zinc finger, CCHC-type [Tanacetum cinerariifolium]